MAIQNLGTKLWEMDKDGAITQPTISVPTDPPADNIKSYPQALDANNDVYTIKQKISGSIVEVFSF
jgi:hypothetical protein